MAHFTRKFPVVKFAAVFNEDCLTRLHIAHSFELQNIHGDTF